MKVLLEIKNKKASSLIEVLSDLSYVKINILSSKKKSLKEGSKQAVKELKLIQKGKLKANDLIKKL